MNRVNRAQTISTGTPSKSKEQTGSSIEEEQELKKINHLENLNETPRSAPKTVQLCYIMQGWTYFISWSISFYPQIYLNICTQCNGLSGDFATLNSLGVTFYCLYTNGMMIPYVRDAYISRWKSEPGVTIHDLFFANHAFIMANIIYAQIKYYGKSITNQYTLKFCHFAIFGLVILLISMIGSTSILDILYYMSVVKALITIIKYIPQVLLNMRNKSTIGWSMENVVLDLIGGVCSLAQSIVDAIDANDIYIIIGNPIKLTLGLICIAFDVIFIFQYFSYDKDQQDSQDIEPLLVQDSDTNQGELESERD